MSSNNMIESNKKVRLFLLIFICFSLIFISYNHEFWRDEGHMMNMALGSSFNDLLIEGKYEGFFPIHQVLLKFIYFFTGSKEFSLKFLTIFFFILTGAVLFKYRNISNFFFLIILLSYPIFYEYSVINKHYIMLVPSMIYLILEKEKNINTLLFNIIFLCSTGVFGIIISFSFVISNLKFFFPLKKNFLIKFISFLICIYFTSFLFPIADRLWNPIRIPNLENAIYILKRILLTTNYISNFFQVDSLWESFKYPSGLKSIFIMLMSITFFFFIFFNILRKCNINELFFYLSTNILLFFFFLISSHHGNRHYFIILLFSYFFSAKIIYLNSKRDLYVFCLKYLTLILLIISFFNTSYISIKDYYFNFSNSKKLADFLKKENINCSKILSFPAYSFNSWSVYFDKKCTTLFLENRKIASFYTLKGHSDNYDFTKLKDLILFSDKNYLILSCSNKCSEEYNQVLEVLKRNKRDIKIFNQDTLVGNREKFLLINLNNIYEFEKKI